MPKPSVDSCNRTFTIDLHTHLRGTISPDLAHRFAEEHDHYLSESLFNGRGGYRFSDFDDFLRLYDQVGAVIRTARDLERLTEDYLARVAASDTRYVEFMLSPDHSEDNGIDLVEQFDAIALGIERARKHDIRASVIVTAVRHRGPEAAVELVEAIADLNHPIVTGFGLTGNERAFDVNEFSGAFYVARDLGLGLTAHTGEWLEAQSVLRTVNELDLNRIGHGCSIVHDELVLGTIADRGVGIEVCLSSNLMLDRVSNLAEHPIKRMLDAGCAVTLATDDPGYFHTTPEREYLLAQTLVGLTKGQIDRINANAILTAFCSEETKQELRTFLHA